GADNRFTLSNRFTQPGVYHMCVRTFDDDGGVGIAMLAVTVPSAPPRLLLGSAETIRAGEGMRHTPRFTAAGPATWRATVDYRDGSAVQPLAIQVDQKLFF